MAMDIGSNGLTGICCLGFLVSTMKLGNIKTLFILLIVGFVAVSGCAPAARIKKDMPLSPEVLRALEDFKRAERLSEQQDYEGALAIYQDYLKRYPKGSVADRALMQTGLVYMAMGDYPRARESFEKLLLEHGKSPFVDDARFNKMLTFYAEGDYESAVTFGRSALALATTAEQEFRISRLLGFAFSAKRQLGEAITSFMRAYGVGSEQEQGDIIRTVKEIVTYLKAPELEVLLDRFENRAPSGYLRLQLAREYAAEDRIEEAVQVLSDFMVFSPDHDEIQAAMELMEALESRSLVDPFLVGCILPLSGPYATFGERALTGIELALDEINRRPGTYPIQLVIKDSRGDPNEAVAALESLVFQDGVIGILGPMLTSESVAIRAQALRVPIITLTQKPGITATGDYVFRNFLTASLQVKSLVDYAVGQLGLERFAILYPEEPYGMSFMNRFWDELIRHGAEVVAIESYLPNQTDFEDAIKKLVGLYYPRVESLSEKAMADHGEADDSGVWQKFLRYEQEPMEWEDVEPPDSPADDAASDHDQQDEQEKDLEPIVDFEAIFIPDSYEKVVLIAPQLLYHDVEDVLLLGTNLWHSQKLLDMAGGYVQWAVTPDGFFVDSFSPEVRNFVARYEEVFGISPAFLEAQAYDVAMIIFEAMNDPDVRSRYTLMMGLKQVQDFPGVTGRTSFDETGDAIKELYLLTVKGRRFVQIRP